MNEVFSIERTKNNALNTDYDRLLEYVRAEGMDYNWAKMFVHKLEIHEQAFAPDESIKRWALERGFYPGRVEMYGLNDSNYQQYLPDYSYFMTHPINHHFRKWLDKLTLKYVINSNDCEMAMPEYYIYVENNGNYTYLMDFPKDVKKDENVILNLLKAKGYLMIKPNSASSGGRGVMKLEWKNGVIILNNRPIEMTEYETIVQNIGNNIITEYCHQHSGLDIIWPDSECTLRVVMAKLPYEKKWHDAEWINTVAHARFGAAITGGASNISAGGIGVGFDFQTGALNDFGIRARRFCANGNYICNEHPDTHTIWKGISLPNWVYTRDMINRICQQISSLDYLGMDIIITQDGMKLCEINTHPAADYEQIVCGPILADEKARRFFEYHGLYEYDNRRFYEMYMKAQRANP